MTRASQKAKERRHTESFFRSLLRGEEASLVYVSHDPPVPDVLVRGICLAEVAGAGVDGVAIEHTEYHPAAWGSASYQRSEVDSRWLNELQPAIETARRANPAVKSVAASFGFKDLRLPKKRAHREIAEDLVQAIKAALPQIVPGLFFFLVFISRESLSRIPNQLNGVAFLPLEDFPLAAEHFDYIKLAYYPEEEWPLWRCPRMLAGWNAPSENEFSRILKAKAQESKDYDTQSWPLWLLIVAELLNDQESHIVPREECDMVRLREEVLATGFDFANGPFQQVWLFSEFTGGTIRLYPVGSVVS